MTPQRKAFVTNLLNRMTLDEKIGQCFTFSWRGSLITPAILDTIEKLHAGGLRIEPYTVESARGKYYGRTLRDENYQKSKDYFAIAETLFSAKHPGPSVPPVEYAKRLNQLQALATARPSGVPLHIALDNEGAITNDYQHGGLHGFPTQMGLAATNDPGLVEAVAKAIGQQLRAVGVTMLHSPVCDVNVNADNPEINFRSFSNDPARCGELALRFARGLSAAGIVATAKHFPGRGAAETDAHHHLEFINVDRKRMHAVDLLPYKRLIESGAISAIMTAHCVFPCYEPDNLPSTLSPRILTDLLRNELGFDGVITTDAMGMGAIVDRWGVPRACVMALKAGANLMLVKSDDAVKTQSFFEMKSAVESGEISEAALNESVGRVLGMKYDQGLFENKGQVNAAKADEPVHCVEIKSLARKAAVNALCMLRQEEGILPLQTDQKILVIEQVKPLEFITNDLNYHAHVFNEAMIGHSRNIVPADCAFDPNDEEIEYLVKAAAEVDCIVVTNFYWRHYGKANERLIARLAESGKPVIAISNTPYTKWIPASAATVLCTFSTMPESLKAAADCLFGEITPTGELPVTNA